MKFEEMHELPILIHTIRIYPKRNIAIGLELFALLFSRPIEMRYATWDQFDLEKAEPHKAYNVLESFDDKNMMVFPQKNNFVDILRKARNSS